LTLLRRPRGHRPRLSVAGCLVTDS
jgi:hypothetical protein